MLGTREPHLLRLRPPLRARLLRRPRAAAPGTSTRCGSTASGSGRWTTAFPPSAFRTYPKEDAARGGVRLLPRGRPARAALLAAQGRGPARARDRRAAHARPADAQPAARGVAGRAADARRPGLRRRGVARHALLHRDARAIPTEPPGERVLDFEEYTELYRESWGDPTIRWLLSTVSTAMIFDDHDVHDDWNISAGLARGDARQGLVEPAHPRRAGLVLGLPAPRQPRARRAPGGRAARAREGGRRRGADPRGVRPPGRPRDAPARAGATAATSGTRAWW